MSEATVKLRAGGERIVVTGEGNGPVNALDQALRQAIGQAYPEVAKFELIDYKVRILDQGHGTDAITRVLIETTDGESSWVTVGVGAQRHRGVLGRAGRRADVRPAPPRGLIFRTSPAKPHPSRTMLRAPPAPAAPPVLDTSGDDPAHRVLLPLLLVTRAVLRPAQFDESRVGREGGRSGMPDAGPDVVGSPSDRMSC